METKILQMSVLTPMAVKFQTDGCAPETVVLFLDFFNEKVYDTSYGIRDDYLGLAVREILQEKKRNSQTLKVPQEYVKEAMARHESSKTPSVVESEINA